MNTRGKKTLSLNRYPVYMLQLAMGLLLYLGILMLTGVTFESLSSIGTLDWGSLFASLILTILLTGFISLRWRLLANALAGVPALSLVDSFFYVLAGRSIG